MQSDYVGVLDSGIGGISLLLKLNKLTSNKTVFYYSDSQNLPYGNKGASELYELAVEGVLTLKACGVSVIFIACNTLSAVVFSALKERFADITFYGVFPPIEKVVMEGVRPLLLCTVATAKAYSDCEVDLLPFRNLAKDIEGSFNFNSINLEEHLQEAMRERAKTCFDHETSVLTTKKPPFNLNNNFYQKRVVILGCTHYFFIKNLIIDHFQPQKILDGSDFAVSKFIKENKEIKTLDYYKRNKILFVGKDSKKNLNFYNKRSLIK